MNGLQIFENSKFGSIRTIIINNEPFFVGKDIAEILGYVDTYGALKKHVDEEDKQNCQNDSFETPMSFGTLFDTIFVELNGCDSCRYFDGIPSKLGSQGFPKPAKGLDFQVWRE